MVRTCASCEQTFEIAPEDLIFYEKVSPRLCGKTLLIPPPTFCPECRKRRRLAWRNEYHYYQRECDLCHRKIITAHSPEKPYPVYCNYCWWGDGWDRFSAGREFDFSRSFFEQFVELQAEVPQMAMMTDNGTRSENCDYCQDLGFSKNCYLVTGSWHLRDVLYSTNCNHSRDLVDCDAVNLECELVYESVDSQHLYDCTFLQSCSNCSDCHFGLDLRGCRDCFLSFGLRQKRFHIYNKAYSEEEYRKKVQSFDLGSAERLEQLKRDFSNFIAEFPRKAVHQVNCEDCYGDNLFNCRNTLAFDTFRAEHCKYFYKGDSPLYCYDIYQSGNPKWCYECVTPDNSYMTCFTTWCFRDNKHVLYSDCCYYSEHLFGCAGLKRAHHAVLNKTYKPEEYEKLVLKIINHMQETKEWGEFFPEQLSPFGYNETVAQELFPLSEEEALSRGYRWKQPDQREYQPQEFDLPDHIDEISDSITKETLACRECGRNYRITTLELSFYRKMRLALPRLCSHCRRRNRNSQRKPYVLFSRQCDKCQQDIHTPYAPGRPERVLCEPCYLEELY